MKIRLRETLIGLGLVVLLLITSIINGQQQLAASYENPLLAGSSHTNQPTGARALYLWLESLGYRVERLEYSDYRLDPEAALLFVLSPGWSQPFTDAEARRVADWVRAGGTLVYADRAPTEPLLAVFNLETEMLDSMADTRPADQPILSNPPLATLPLEPYMGLKTTRRDTVVLSRVGEQPVALGFPEGQGQVWFFTDLTPFTTESLRADPASASLVLNIVGHLPEAATILFDEFHHGFVQAPSLSRELWRQPWGWAVLYTALICFAWFVLRGRRLGRPVPLPHELRRREAGEFVTSMAHLMRRAKRREPIAFQLYTELKRTLATPLRLDPRQHDDHFVADLARLRPDLGPDDAERLRSLFVRLKRPIHSEHDLLALAREAAAWEQRARPGGRPPVQEGRGS